HLVDAERKDQVRVQISLIPVQHKVGVKPVVKGPPGSNAGRHGLASGGFDRAGLQAEARAVGDRIGSVIQNAVEPLVQIRDVVAAVKVVVNENLPVAVDDPLAASGKVQLIEAQGLERLDHP